MEKTQETRLFEIQVREVEYEKDGKKAKFLAFNTFNEKDERVDVRFVKDAFNKAPTENCYVRVAKKDWNLSKKYRYPRLYIQDVIEILPLDTKDDLPF